MTENTESSRWVLGNEDAGFSEAFVSVDGEWREIEASAFEKETKVIDFDATKQSLEDLLDLTDRRSDAIGDDQGGVRKPHSGRRQNGSGRESGRSVPAQTDGGVTDGDAK